VRAAGSRVAPEPPTPHPHYSGWQISWQLMGILPKRKRILAQVCLEAQHCEGFAEIRSGSCGGVKGLNNHKTKMAKDVFIIFMCKNLLTKIYI